LTLRIPAAPKKRKRSGDDEKERAVYRRQITQRHGPAVRTAVADRLARWLQQMRAADAKPLDAHNPLSVDHLVIKSGDEANIHAGYDGPHRPFSSPLGLAIGMHGR
jgi:aminoglycoside phosphotransferase (APT) family kinase protein